MVIVHHWSQGVDIAALNGLTSFINDIAYLVEQCIVAGRVLFPTSTYLLNGFFGRTANARISDEQSEGCINV